LATSSWAREPSSPSLPKASKGHDIINCFAYNPDEPCFVNSTVVEIIPEPSLARRCHRLRLYLAGCRRPARSGDYLHCAHHQRPRGLLWVKSSAILMFGDRLAPHLPPPLFCLQPAQLSWFCRDRHHRGVWRLHLTLASMAVAACALGTARAPPSACRE
jgi:hypothetical protein